MRATSVEVHIHGVLNDLLPAAVRERPIRQRLVAPRSVKDLIESLGVPHVEIESITADGLLVPFEYRVRGRERIDVFPAVNAGPGPAGAQAVTSTSRNDDLRFVADGHLGRLAAYLRMLGFDTAYASHASDDVLAVLAAGEDRILLSRDRGLLKRSIVRRGYVLRSDRPHEQLREVTDRFGLASASRPFGRCLRCNGLLDQVSAAIARPLVPPRVASEQSEFRRCGTCGALYWRGSHYARMVRLIETLLPEVHLSL